jgi:hypothetical protein
MAIYLEKGSPESRLDSCHSVPSIYNLHSISFKSLTLGEYYIYNIFMCVYVYVYIYISFDNIQIHVDNIDSISFNSIIFSCQAPPRRTECECNRRAARGDGTGPWKHLAKTTIWSQYMTKYIIKIPMLTPKYQSPIANISKFTWEVSCMGYYQGGVTPKSPPNGLRLHGPLRSARSTWPCQGPWVACRDGPRDGKRLVKPRWLKAISWTCLIFEYIWMVVGVNAIKLDLKFMLLLSW